MRKFSQRSILAALLLLAAVASAQAQSTTPDATSIVTTATTLFGVVGALVISMVGFFIGVRIVKGIRK